MSSTETVKEVKPEEQWERVGTIGVDAGLCWLGDPCYILHTKHSPKDIGKNWGEFCSKLHEGTTRKDYHQFDYDIGHAGLGVAVQTGWGDGSYPVLVKRGPEGRIAEVKVVFIGLDEEAKNIMEHMEELQAA